MTDVSVIGLDIAKQVFHLVGLNASGKCVLKKKLRRAQLLTFFANLVRCTIAMEGCASSSYWARELSKLGHQVKLLPAQYVKAHVRGNKNDYNDALGIAEACRVPEMRTVTIKTVEQQTLQSLQCLRRTAVADRSALSCQVRGLLGEYGIVFNTGVSTLRKALPDILEDADNNLRSSFRSALTLKYTQLCQLDELIEELTNLIQQESRQHPEVQRLQTIPGFGPVVASAFYGVIGDGQAFKNGRGVSASLGLVPRHHGTGGQQVLLGISKRGDKYLRSLLVHGARAVVRHAHKKDDALSVWVIRLIERRGKNKAIVALANKLARIAWAVLAQGKDYQVKLAV